MRSALHEHYDERFYADQVEGSVRSARVVVPLVLDLIGPIGSVVDVGCGTGSWLHKYEVCGVRQGRGIDGGKVEERFLQIDPACLVRRDLSHRLGIRDRFDLCVSLEVAEHLPEARGPSFVEDLCSLADVVLFGAAVPGQGGQNHVNEHC